MITIMINHWRHRQATEGNEPPTRLLTPAMIWGWSWWWQCHSGLALMSELVTVSLWMATATGRAVR